MSNPLVSVLLGAASLALSVVPVWLAAKVVGAGRTEFLRTALALVLPVIALFPVALLIGKGSLLVFPLLFWVSFKYVLSTSFFGAFVLMILWAAFAVAMSKFLGAIGWASVVAM